MKLFRSNFFFLLLLLATLDPIPIKAKTIRFLVTSDMHGWFSSSYLYPAKKPFGLLHLEPLIKEIRKKHPDVLLLDAGDTLSGSPLSHFLLNPDKNNYKGYWQTLISLKFSAIVPGNHDLEVFSKGGKKYSLLEELPWTSVNPGSGCPAMPLFRSFKVQGVQIAIIGIITPDSQSKTQECKALVFEDSLAKLLKYLEDKVKPDLKVGLLHTGISPLRNLRKRRLDKEGIDPSGMMIGRFIKKFDVVFSGHDHRLTRKGNYRTIQGIPVFEPGFQAKKLLYVTLTLGMKGEKGIKKIDWIYLKPQINKLISSRFIESLPDEYRWLMEDSTGVKRVYKKKTTFQNFINDSFTRALLKSGSDCVLHRRIKLNSRDVGYGKLIKRKHLIKWMPYANTFQEIVLSVRALRQLKKLKGYHLTCNDENMLNDQGSNWFLSRDEFKEKYTLRISDYLARGGGGILKEIPFSNKLRLNITSDKVGQEILFDHLSQTSDK